VAGHRRDCLANEPFAIAREPDFGYCVMVGGTCQYAADNREFDECEPEKVILVDDSYLACMQRWRGHGSRWHGVRSAGLLSFPAVLFTPPAVLLPGRRR
jgi:hypothetical protein